MNISFPPPGSDDQAAPTYPAAAEIACDGWWPSVNLIAVRDAVRVPSGETERLRDAVRQAMLDIAHELAAWRAQQEAAGYARLADVPGRMTVDGRSDYELRWFRAVYSVVAADVGERALGPQLSGAGADRAEALRADVDTHLRNVSSAVRDFLGRPRIMAEAL
jgi:hypothetical protein